MDEEIRNKSRICVFEHEGARDLKWDVCVIAMKEQLDNAMDIDLHICDELNGIITDE